jgi:hypothetical protein
LKPYTLIHNKFITCSAFTDGYAFVAILTVFAADQSPVVVTVLKVIAIDDVVNYHLNVFHFSALLFHNVLAFFNVSPTSQGISNL